MRLKSNSYSTLTVLQQIIALVSDRIPGQIGTDAMDLWPSNTLAVADMDTNRLSAVFDLVTSLG